MNNNLDYPLTGYKLLFPHSGAFWKGLRCNSAVISTTCLLSCELSGFLWGPQVLVFSSGILMTSKTKPRQHPNHPAKLDRRGEEQNPNSSLPSSLTCPNISLGHKIIIIPATWQDYCQLSIRWYMSKCPACSRYLVKVQQKISGI